MYYEIFKGVITSVATSTITTAVKTAIDHYFGKPSKTEQTEEEIQYPIISIPLAIGYYYNFIEKIEDRLAGDNFTVKKHYSLQGEKIFDSLNLSEDQKSRLSPSELNQLYSKKHEMAEFLGQFDSKDVSVELIYPSGLNNKAIRRCSNYLFEETNKGSIESTVGGRPYGINYADMETNSASKIHILDYTRPVEVILKYYQEVKGIGGFGGDQDLWKRIEEREMEAFLYTLKYMIDEKSKFLFDKVYFRPYDLNTEDEGA